MVSLPNIIVWVIFCPLLAFVVLFKHRHNLDEGPEKQYLFILYQGLVDRCYYWEFVNTIRKSLLLTLTTVLSVVPTNYRILSSIVILVSIIYLQKWLKPYKVEENNSIDIKALLAGIMVLYTGILFDEDSYKSYEGFNIFAMLMLAFINILFLVEWLYLLLVSWDFKNENLKAIVKIYGWILCKPKVYNDQLKKLDQSKEPKPSRVRRKLKLGKKSTTAYVEPKPKVTLPPKSIQKSDKSFSKPEELSRLKYLDSTISDKMGNLDDLITPLEESKTPILPHVQENSISLDKFNQSCGHYDLKSPTSDISIFKSVLNALAKRQFKQEDTLANDEQGSVDARIENASESNR